MSELVIVRCQRCRRRLGSLDTMPDDWSGTLTVLRCPKCVLPPPHKLIHVLKKQQAAGGFALQAGIPLAKLRRHALHAQAQRRAVTVSVRPYRGAQ